MEYNSAAGMVELKVLNVDNEMAAKLARYSDFRLAVLRDV